MILTDFISRLIIALTETHPLHSMTVHFPIAFTGAGLLFILLALWQRNEGLERAAFYNITLTALTSVIASFTGYRDYITRYEGDAPFANVKIFLGLTLFILTTVMAVSRWRQTELLWTPSTMILYLLGFAGSFGLALTLGFLGGVILYGF